jgi:hypothetical protein
MILLGENTMDKYFILKAHLFEEGIKISTGAKKLLDAQSDIWLMDDYITCSGVTMNFGDEYVTAGVNPNSKYELLERNGGFVISDDGEDQFKTSVIVPPDYMKDDIVIEDKTITTYANTYTDRVRIQLNSGCANRCKFCNATEFKYEMNSIEGIEQTLKIALSQSDVSHMLISNGSVKIEDLEKLTNMYEYFGKQYSHLSPDIMLTPRGFTSYTDWTQYERYIRHLCNAGISGLSVNIELHNPDMLKRFCPEKAAIGQDNYFRFIEAAVAIFGKNAVRSLLIVGLEPLEETLRGVEKLAERGCNPVLSPLFPYGEANTPPNANLFIEAKAKSEEICSRHDIKMGPLCRPCSHNVL